jgi:hypothetical protein
LIELFHALEQPDSAAARRAVMELGVKASVDFRNVFYEEAAADLLARGGSLARLPALWDGERLHEGLPAVQRALAAIPR